MGSTGRCFTWLLTQFFLVLAIAAVILWAQSAYGQAQLFRADAQARSIDDAHSNRSFHLGGFFTGGFVPNYHLHYFGGSRTVELNIFNAGLSAGKVLTAAHGRGPFRGRLEADVELMPFWVGDYPKQTQALCIAGLGCGTSPWSPYRSYGMSVTPWLTRWNFVGGGTHRILPWAELGGGLLWTNHKFPLLGGSTSVINFTPQVGIGQSLFVRKNRSLDFAFKAVHISNAGLGDNNPGLNVTLQFSAGYSWWK